MLRKDAGLNLNDEASVYFSNLNDELKDLLTKMEVDIKHDTRSSSLEIVAEINTEHQKEALISGHKFLLGLKI